MKKRFLSLILGSSLAISVMAMAPVSANTTVNSPPTTDLDFWVEAEDAVTDANGFVTSWTSKVVSTSDKWTTTDEGKIKLHESVSSPRVDNATAPKKVIDPELGRAVLSFKGNGIRSDLLNTTVDGEGKIVKTNIYQGDITVVALAKQNDVKGNQGGGSTILKTGHTGSDATSRQMKVFRATSSPWGPGGNYQLGSTSDTHSPAFTGTLPSSAAESNYVVLTAVSKASEVDDPTPYVDNGIGKQMTLTLYANNAQYSTTSSSVKVSDSDIRKVGYDTISAYQIGEHCREDIVAVLVYKSALNEAERTQAYEYLKQKYLDAPSINTVAVDETGSQITITTNVNITGTVSKSDFALTVDGSPANENIESATISTSNTITVNLSTPIQFGQVVNIGYSGTGVTGVNLVPLKAIIKDVNTSAIPEPAGEPEVLSVRLGIYGDKIELKTNKNPNPEEDMVNVADFTISDGTKTIPVTNVEIKGISYVLYLESRFKAGDSVNVTYDGDKIILDTMPATPYDISENTIKAMPDLDLLLEADDPAYYTLSGGKLDTWTSKVDSLIKSDRSPHVLNTVAGHNVPSTGTFPVTLPDGRKTMFINRRGLASANPGAEPLYRGEMTLFIMSMRNSEYAFAGNSTVFGTTASGASARGVQLYSKGSIGDGLRTTDTNNRGFYGFTETKPESGAGSTTEVGYSTNMFDVKTLRTTNRPGTSDPDNEGKPLKRLEASQNGVVISAVDTYPLADAQNPRGVDTIWGYSTNNTNTREYLSAALAFTRSLNDLEKEVVEQYLYNKYGTPFSPSNLAFQYAQAGTTEWSDTLPTAGGGKVRITGGVSNRTGVSTASAYAVGAVYDGDRLHSVQTVSLENFETGTIRMFADNRTGGANTADNMILDLPESLDNMKIKLMIWDGETMRPLFENIRPSMAHIVSAVASEDGTTITVTFSEPIEGTLESTSVVLYNGSSPSRTDKDIAGAELTDETTLLLTMDTGKNLTAADKGKIRLSIGTGQLIVKSDQVPLRTAIDGGFMVNTDAIPAAPTE